MRKKHWLIGLLGLTALVLGLGSATVLAQESSGEQTRLGLFARMANILGLEEEQVQEAYEQARQELRDEQFEEMVGQRLDALVESGHITQEQADELREWYASRPDSFWLASGMDRGKHGHSKRGRMFDGRGYSAKGPAVQMPAASQERLTRYLDALVEEGHITQDQAAQLRELYASRMGKLQHDGRFDRGKGSTWQRGRGQSHQGGFHIFRGFAPGKGFSVPIAPTTVPDSATPTTAPEATPAAPADSSDDN